MSLHVQQNSLKVMFNWYIYSYSTYAEASGLQEVICMNIWM